MKLFAYYLPQFHCIPENDKWWGKGFTEWTNVKKAQPLFKGHIQPKRPLNDNYYSLEDISTLKWQSKLINDYKVDGLIFYHYYFNGKKLLEKPAEMLLNNKDIDINYFFCWANHSWIRSWEGTKELLIEQTYGKENDWEKHFQYLLQFFKDKRYEKRNNKPLFVIFKSDFEEKKDMFNYFNKRCIDSGFNGICIIETIETHNKKIIEEKLSNVQDYEKLVHLREPGSSIMDFSSNPINIPLKIVNKIRPYVNNVKKYDGNRLFNTMIKSYYEDKNIIRGLFFEWDNTPRHSKRGYIITPPRKEVFMEYLAKAKNEEYLFINAWNEWCEGMIMEPTTENQYKYLEWIKEFKKK